jgi:hypothetical protein
VSCVPVQPGIHVLVPVLRLVARLVTTVCDVWLSEGSWRIHQYLAQPLLFWPMKYVAFIMFTTVCRSRYFQLRRLIGLGRKARIAGMSRLRRGLADSRLRRFMGDSWRWAIVPAARKMPRVQIRYLRAIPEATYRFHLYCRRHHHRGRHLPDGVFSEHLLGSWSSVTCALHPMGFCA